jgi:hypothetical protein
MHSTQNYRAPKDVRMNEPAKLSHHKEPTGSLNSNSFQTTLSFPSEHGW